MTNRDPAKSAPPARLQCKPMQILPYLNSFLHYNNKVHLWLTPAKWYIILLLRWFNPPLSYTSAKTSTKVWTDHSLSSFATKPKEIWPALFTCHRWGLDKSWVGQGRLVTIIVRFSYLRTRPLTAVSYRSHRVRFTLSTLDYPSLTIVAQFHVDNLSSAHVYLRLRDGETWDNIPQKLVEDCAQLTKANSIEGPLPITI